MKAEHVILGIFIVLTIALIAFSMFGYKILISQTKASSNYSNIPEKCRPSDGQDIASWKEHLSHHAETEDCLQYFK
ncbi:hypothetical protein J4404_03120 [Candidatus Woesearchaeota archaeon]|nr:hypothetical protein [Candidatus Woesearchaeota archaeon]